MYATLYVHEVQLVFDLATCDTVQEPFDDGRVAIRSFHCRRSTADAVTLALVEEEALRATDLTQQVPSRLDGAQVVFLAGHDEEGAADVRCYRLEIHRPREAIEPRLVIGVAAHVHEARFERGRDALEDVV